MRRFAIVALLVLLPVFAFGAEKSTKAGAEGCKYYMDGSKIEGVTCRDKCLANEKIIKKIQIMDGEHKGEVACTTCFEKGVKNSKGGAVPSKQVPCMKE